MEGKRNISRGVSFALSIWSGKTQTEKIKKSGLDGLEGERETDEKLLGARGHGHNQKRKFTLLPGNLEKHKWRDTGRGGKVSKC